jgi:hypothetical protein
VNYRSIIAALASGIMVAACSSTGVTSGGGVPSAFSTESMAAQSKGKAARLFVANDGYVGIYNAATGVREKAICKGGPVFRTLFVTRTGMAIVGRPERSGVTIYGGPKMAQLQKINIPHPLALATDAKGNLFVLSAFKGKRVEVFAPGSSRPISQRRSAPSVRVLTMR